MKNSSLRSSWLLAWWLVAPACSNEDSSPERYAMDASSALPAPGNALPDAAVASDAGAAPPGPGQGMDASPPSSAGPDASALDAGPMTPSALADAAADASVAASGDGALLPSDAGMLASDAMQGPLADYAKRGPYMVKQLLNQGMGTISNGDSALLPLTSNNDPNALTIYFPSNAGEGERFPLLTFGNGTFCSPTFYDELINHVVSHGFVVVAANTSTVGNGQPMIKALDWALAQNMQSGSPLFGKIDPEQLGAFGHSQGGAGTCNAGLDPRIDTIVPLSGVPLNEDAGTGTISKIKVPIFFVNTADEAAGATLIEDSFNAAQAPAAYGVTTSGNHDEYTDIVDDPGVPGLTSNDAKNSRAGVAAWFAWQLKGKSAVRSLFVGANCGFCSGSTWKLIKSKGL